MPPELAQRFSGSDVSLLVVSLLVPEALRPRLDDLCCVASIVRRVLPELAQRGSGSSAHVPFFAQKERPQRRDGRPRMLPELAQRGNGCLAHVLVLVLETLRQRRNRRRRDGGRHTRDPAQRRSGDLAHVLHAVLQATLQRRECFPQCFPGALPGSAFRERRVLPQLSQRRNCSNPHTPRFVLEVFLQRRDGLRRVMPELAQRGNGSRAHFLDKILETPRQRWHGFVLEGLSQRPVTEPTES